MRNAAEREFFGQIIKSIQILDDQAELTHQPRIFKILFEIGIEFSNKERIFIRQGGDERRIDGEIVFSWMTCAAGPAVAIKRFIKKDLSTHFDQLGIGTRRWGWRRGRW